MAVIKFIEFYCMNIRLSTIDTRKRGARQSVVVTTEVIKIIGAVVVLLAVVLGLVRVFENRIVYHPVRYPGGDWDTAPRAYSREEVEFEAEDGVRLHGWYAAANENPSGVVVLFFHGNAGNITHRHDNIELLAEAGADVFIVSYRGYGRSEGRPSEEGLYRDAEAAYRELTERRGIPPERIVVFGRSLGSAVAADLSARREVAGVILEAPFASAADMAREMLPILPVQRVIRSRFESIRKLDRIEAPLLIIHGENDTVVPFEHGERLYETASEPKEFYPIPGAGHNDTYQVAGEEYFARLRSFWERALSTNSEG